MNGTIETVLTRGDDSLLVLYKCPHCCTGDMQIKMELRSTKQEFVTAMTRDGAMLMNCGNCEEEFLLVAGQGVRNMLRLV